MLTPQFQILLLHVQSADIFLCAIHGLRCRFFPWDLDFSLLRYSFVHLLGLPQISAGKYTITVLSLPVPILSENN